MTKPTVFLSYSHKDEEWKDRLLPHLEALQQADRIVVWDDRQIDAGEQWYDEIRQAMDQAAVAVCLVSPDYLASAFVIKEEVRYLLERRSRDGIVILPVLLRDCPWQAFEWISLTQMLPRDGKSVVEDFEGRENRVFADVGRRVLGVVDDPQFQLPGPAPALWSPPEKVDIARLPATGLELFGRQKELAMLDADWESGDTNVVSLVAWGGTGKSTLVNRWLERLQRDNYRGARRVYGWSFYSQGTGKRVASADEFISHALGWFGDLDPTEGSPWDKGQRLADLVRSEKTLLVLDGMEPLQSDLDVERGAVKDPALSILLAELARGNPGLCVVTTRESVADLGRFPETSRRLDLERLSAWAGRELLRAGGVLGTDAELEQATRDFGYHALALSLLVVYLRETADHQVSHAAGVPALDIPEEEGKHPRRVIAGIAERLAGRPELDLLRVLGLFDRPADEEAIAAVVAAPPIPGLTDHVQGLSDAGQRRLVGKLREAGLIAGESHHSRDNLDAHPIVREHFGEMLRTTSPDAWKEAHSRLYVHYSDQAPELPDTLEEMAPLFHAVAHGCQAGRHQVALDEVYRLRIARRGEFFSIFKLGAFGADLAALSGFFDEPWHRPVDGITDAAKAFVLGVAGFSLRALGRLSESAQPTQAALQGNIAREDWRNAASAASNLSQLYLTLGDLARALDYAQQGVHLADKSGDPFQRMGNQTVLAAALHQGGRLGEADALFREAEAMQKEREPEYQLLYAFQGFLYCDLLLGEGKDQEVHDRAGQTLKWAETHLSLLDIALDHLSIGRAHLLEVRQKGVGDLSKAVDHLDRAVNGLRQAGTQDELPRGLLARAELYRVRGDFQTARRDLDEAMSIAERGSMGLHLADSHLEYARLHLAMGARDKAHQSLATARKMVEEMGYHRRDPELAELEEQLAD